MALTDHTILSDGSVLLAGDNGDVDPAGEPAGGLYVADTRLLSTWQVSLVGQPLVVATARDETDRRLVVQAGPSRRNQPPGILLVREQVTGTGGLTERISVRSPRPEPVAVTLRLVFGCDFADQFRVRSDGRSFDLSGARTSSTLHEDGVECGYVHEYDGRRFTASCRLTLDPAPGSVTASADGGTCTFEWDLRLGPGEGADVVAVVSDGSATDRGGPGADRRPDPGTARAPGRGASRPVARLRRRNLADLDALTISVPGDEGLRVPAAGAPWFLTMFGRDGLLTSELATADRPALAGDVLRALAKVQGRVDDPASLEQPGRIVHEVRRSELATLGQVPYGRYYGSVDATPLFLVSLGREVARHDDRALAADLERAARDAVSWMRGPGGLDQHGFLVYRPDPAGLLNHGWKDSHDATVFADGRLADGPIALVEVQGYAWEALRRTARLAREHWADPAYADRLEAWAAALRRRLREAFWMPEEGFFALAVDGHGRQVDALSSNVGHLLWSGALDRDEAAQVAARLLAEDFHSGWGIRTLAAGQVPYSPMSYHNGSVWPHDTALVMAGLAGYGLHAEARRLAEGLLDAAEAFDGRMPELFAGWSRRDIAVPVPYAYAGRPQAWSAAAGLAATQVLRGGDSLEA